MIRTFTLLFATFFSLYGAELEWAQGYGEAMKKARMQKKNVMLLITTPTCRWCRKLESATLKNEEVVTRLSRDYIVLHVTRDVDDYPVELETNGVPTTYFLDETGRAIIKRVTGYWNAEDYLSFMDDVDYKLGRKTY